MCRSLNFGFLQRGAVEYRWGTIDGESSPLLSVSAVDIADSRTSSRLLEQSSVEDLRLIDGCWAWEQVKA
jgi:hypothetical protein